jgi:hypothetical protein
MKTTTLLFLSLSACATAAENGAKVKPGELIVDYPTLINLGFEWVMEGDEDRNARVDLSTANRARQSGRRGCRSCGCKASGYTRTRVLDPYLDPTRQCAGFHSRPAHGSGSGLLKFRRGLDRPVVVGYHRESRPTGYFAAARRADSRFVR